MADSNGSAVTRVVSRDSTEIGCWISGVGPPLVLVHGTPADHTRWQPLLPYLEPHATVVAMDRRGRGASGDGPKYGLERECEDVAAVVDAIAAAYGSSVDVYGHSHGGFCAFGAAALTSNIRRLVLYEGWPAPDPEVYALPAGFEKRLDALLAEGLREEAVEAICRELLMMSDDELAAFRAAPSWQGRVAAAHTVTRECRAEAQARLDPREAAKIAAPVLLIAGAESGDPSRAHMDAVAAALPDARTVMLEGQEHVADVLVPETFARHLRAFLHDHARTDG